MTDDIEPYTYTDGHKIINLDNYLAYYFVVIANRLSRGSSSLYKKQFGIGVVEWRCMVMLAIETGVSAARVTEISGINKSLVSRSLKKLEALGYVEDFNGSTSRKPRRLQFTKSGLKLYDRVVEVTLEREKKLETGLSNEEVKELLRMLRILRKNAMGLSR